MEAGFVDQQEGAKSSASGITLSAQQLYQHDPLLVLLKDKFRLNDLWIIAGGMVYPGCFFLISWLGWASKGRVWIPGDTVSALLLTFGVFPFLFLIYLLVPASIANLFNTLRINEVIGEPRRHQPGAETYKHFVQQLITWIDSSWWTAATLAILVFYVCYRLLLIEPGIASPIPY
jgi:hypothetical protein